MSIHIFNVDLAELLVIHNDFILSLDLEHAITSKHSEAIWVTVCGTLKQSLTEDELSLRVLGELENLYQSEHTSEEKLFAIHRSIAYALKESATGADYTYPIRLTAVILNNKGKLVFQHIHFSFPCCWKLEGKIDSFKL